jgi:sugar (pentulose or hexulose) kinase
MTMRGNGWAPAARHPALLGVDLTGDSVISVDTDVSGQVLARADARVELSRPRSGWVEADPHDWLAAAARTAAAALGAGLADVTCAQIVLGHCARVVASIRALPGER